MRNYQYNRDTEQSGSSGYFQKMMTRATADNPSGQTGEINVSKFNSPKSRMKVTGHEGQHAVSDREGWPVGGSPHSARSKALANKLGVTPREAYRMYSDEILANVVMNRWDMTDAERKAIMPDASGTSHIISRDPDAIRVASPANGGKPYGSFDKITPNPHKKSKTVTEPNTVGKSTTPRKSWMKPGHNYDASTGGSIFDDINK